MLEQITLNKMALCAYLVGDEVSRQGALIDPAFEVDRILSIATRADLTITHIINTHGHADHTAGNHAVKVATGAQLLIHRRDQKMLTTLVNRGFSRMLGGKGSPPPDRLLDDGDIITIGALDLRVVHTPGHTPGGICLAVENHLLTGDTLFVGAVGRTDLRGGSSRQLLKSVREKIYTLPDDTQIWPGHDYGRESVSTVARERRTNPFTLNQ